jgi:TonB family protein
MTATLAAVCCGAAAATRAQQPTAPDAGEAGKARRGPEHDAVRAQQLYEQGVALFESGRADTPGAVRTFGEALKLYLSLYTEKGLPSSASGGASYRAVRRGRRAHAPECVERYLRLVGVESAFERSQLEAFHGHALALREEDESRTVFFVPEVDTRARITHKPEPGYTEEARQNNVRGVVVLRAVLGSDGKVRHVFVIKGLPHGMSEETVAAAEGIKFTPAVREGRPVSQFVLLEYNFSMY